VSRLKLHKVECRAIVGHYDENGELVNEETSGIAQPIYQPSQFVEFWQQLKTEVAQRNAEEAPPNRAQRRASTRGRKKT